MFKFLDAPIAAATLALALLATQTAQSGEIKGLHPDATSEFGAAVHPASRTSHDKLSEADKRAMNQAAAVARRDHDPALNGSIHESLSAVSLPNEPQFRSESARPGSASVSAK